MRGHLHKDCNIDHAPHPKLRASTWIDTKTETDFGLLKIHKSNRCLEHRPLFVGKFKGVVLWKIVCLVLISVEYHIKINQQGVFRFSITCLVIQIFTVLKYTNIACDVIYSRILNTNYILESEKYLSN